MFNAQSIMAVAKDTPQSRTKMLLLIRRLLERCPSQLQEAMQAWQDGQHQEAGRLFHSLRGSVGSLGAERVATTLLVIEQAIRESEADKVPPLLQQVEQELTQTYTVAQVWLDQELKANEVPPEA